MAPYRAILPYYRCDTPCHAIFFREASSSLKTCDTPSWYLVLHKHTCAIPNFATYCVIIVRYPTKTNTNMFCDIIATSIARYEKHRCWAFICHPYFGRLTLIHLRCWEVLPLLTIQRQRCTEFRVLRAQEFYTQLPLNCQKGHCTSQHCQENEKSAQRGSFRPDIPADIPPKTSVRRSKSWKIKHFGTDIPCGRPRKTSV